MAESSTMNRRPLGIGIINFAYFLAKRGLKYDNEALTTVHEYAEAWSYYLIKASIELAKEKGACPLFHETKYSEGILPIDTYKREVDELVDPKYYMNWPQLRADVQNYGIRNSTLMALMPAETSAQISNATNGFEPPPELVTKKKSKHGTLAQVVPEIQRLKNTYDLRWNQKVTDYLSVAAVMQKFMDQAGSFNTSHNPSDWGGKIPMSILARDVMFAYKYGLKTLYYANPAPTKVEEDASTQDQGPENDAEDCESCVI
jgi:ribonucleoside-diphosphate reductase alpha chain